jgi:hypothetical protein
MSLRVSTLGTREKMGVTRNASKTVDYQKRWCCVNFAMKESMADYKTRPTLGAIEPDCEFGTVAV